MLKYIECIYDSRGLVPSDIPGLHAMCPVYEVSVKKNEALCFVSNSWAPIPRSIDESKRLQKAVALREDVKKEASKTLDTCFK